MCLSEHIFFANKKISNSHSCEREIKSHETPFYIILTWILSLFLISGLSKTYGQQTTTIFHEDFESGIGNWFVDNGVWEVGGPTSCPDSAHNGTKSAGTIIDNNYPPNTNTRLISPQISLPNSLAPEEKILLKFWQWFNTEDCCDKGVVQVSVSGGPWQNISNSISGASIVWTQTVLNISEYVGSTIRIAFYFTSNSGSAVSCGWFIDDISIEKRLYLIRNPESFELGNGDWSVDNGLWEVGVPGIGSDSSHSGINVAGTVLVGNYPANANTRLIGPEISLSETLSAEERILLKFWYWFTTEDCCDKGAVQISVDGGVWQNISNSMSGTSGIWAQQVLDITNFAGSTIRVAFYFTSNSGSGVSSGWYIDDVSIEKRSYLCRNPEDFEQGIGDWSVDNGIWEIGENEVGPGNAHSGNNVAGTVLNGNYPPNANSRLITPKIILSSAINEAHEVRFWHWFNTEDCCDKGIVQISVNGGEWQNISNSISGASIVWTQQVLDLSPYAGSSVQIAFYFVSNSGSAVGSGWFIDDVQLKGTENCGENLCLSVTPESINFGINPVNSETSKQATLTNCGTITVNINSINITGADASNFDFNPKSLSPLNAGETSDLNVIFKPTEIGNFNAALEIHSNGGSANISLSGIAITKGDRTNVPGLFNTGVDVAGNVQPPGSPEIHYSVTGSANSAIVIDPLKSVPGKEWVDPPDSSAWIGPSNSNLSDPIGTYIYKLNFDLSDFDTNNVVISGQVAADNTLSIFLNGKDTGFKPVNNQFLELHNFIIDSGFHQNSNTLEFTVTNVQGSGLNPTGLLVANLSGEGKRFITCPNPSIASIADVPNDQGKQVTIVWNRACPDTAGSEVPIRLYSIWRQDDIVTTNTTINQSESQTNIQNIVYCFDEMMQNVAGVVPGTKYILNTKNGDLTDHSNEIWTFIAATTAMQFEQYAYVAPTLFDSTITSGMKWSKFFVAAHTDNALVWYASQPDSGYSADNLKPTPPSGLVASEIDNGIQLNWEPNPEQDLKHYSIYKSNVSGFELTEPIIFTTDTLFHDTSLNKGNTYYYKITASDFSGNESKPSSEVSILVSSVNENSTQPTDFVLEQNYPNPFNPETTIHFQLPEASYIELVIYNVLGKKVRTLISEQKDIGQFQVKWDGRNDFGKQVTSGIYIYRLNAAAFVHSKKMLLMR